MALRNPRLGREVGATTVSPANGCRRSGVRGRAESVGNVLISTASSPHVPPRHVRRLHLLGTAQDASPPPWSGKSCADVAVERCPGEHDWWVRVAVDPDFLLVPRACLGTWWWR